MQRVLKSPALSAIRSTHILLGGMGPMMLGGFLLFVSTPPGSAKSVHAQTQTVIIEYDGGYHVLHALNEALTAWCYQ